ncbi:MAG: replication factor C small subunit [Thermofilaceae archaeon]|nr:replication factor C small subunit [Thermofilaceae archaeon]MCX8180181.1 replication factor C small subunit [Thermofilaceae archaeon]MDW8004163.1 replication factor C small subunit [Thermofilaceae archaeon]
MSESSLMELWIEKYRPRRLEDMVDQREIVARLKEFVRDRNVPHLLFVGPPGTGKTTAALCLAYELYGDLWRDNTLELNASDERGIDVIRTRIKDYARTVPLGKVPFKIIILDEADNMTGDAQQALRRTMELFSRNTRFILIANYASKIIEPIQSRCAIFRFQPIPKEDFIGRIAYIAKNEGVNVTHDGLEAIWEESMGDLRKAINTLQAAAALEKLVNADVVYKAVGKVTPTEIREMIKLAFAGDFINAREKLRSLLYFYGLSGVDVVKLVYREIASARGGLEIDDKGRLELIEQLGEINYRLVEGADDEIQLNAFLARLALLGKGLAHGGTH